jgi:hypothetical protein
MLIHHTMLIGSVFLIFWLFYKRHIKQMGSYAKGWLPQMAMGLAFGAACITLVIAVLLVSGSAKLSPFNAAGLGQGMFSFMLIKTGRIWAPIGFHMPWNIFQGYISGVPVSGSPVPDSALFKVALSGSEWLTGGNFGAEGGAACTLVVLLGVLFVHFVVKPPSNPQEFWTMDGDLPLTRTQVQRENAG